jgi:hypothetical protein
LFPFISSFKGRFFFFHSFYPFLPLTISHGPLGIHKEKAWGRGSRRKGNIYNERWKLKDEGVNEKGTGKIFYYTVFLEAADVSGCCML